MHGETLKLLGQFDSFQKFLESEI